MSNPSDMWYRVEHKRAVANFTRRNTPARLRSRCTVRIEGGEVMDLLKATAYREAGHAVFSVEYHRSVKHVTIIAHEDALGPVEPQFSRAKVQPDIELTGKTVKWLERELVIMFAGPVAASRFRGCDPQILGADRQTALHIAGRIHTGEVLTKYWDYILERTRQIVAGPPFWAQIELVADALLERGTLTGKQVRDICFEAKYSPPAWIFRPAAECANLPKTSAAPPSKGETCRRQADASGTFDVWEALV